MPQTEQSAKFTPAPVPLSLGARFKRAGSSAFRVFGAATAGSRPVADFMVIGTKRGGTTSLYYDILKLPQVMTLFPSSQYLPKENETKGIHYFDSHYGKGERWYRSHLPSRSARRRAEQRVGDEVIVGEASPYYLFHPLAAQRAHALVPDARLIVLLRDPVMRTYSHWKERRRNAAEPLGFEEALAAEAERLEGEEDLLIADPHYYSYAHEQQSYASQSRYARSLSPWVELFGMDRILVVASEDYYADQASTLNRVADFLSVERIALTVGERRNAAEGGDMASATRDRLREMFAEDNAQLERMIGVKLPWS